MDIEKPLPKDAFKAKVTVDYQKLMNHPKFCLLKLRKNIRLLIARQCLKDFGLEKMRFMQINY